MSKKASTSKAVIEKLPQITLIFWIMKIVATTLGETAGDFLSETLRLWFGIASLILIWIFFATVLPQLFSRKYNPLLYWIVILSTVIGGTTMADYMSISLRLWNGVVSLILFVILTIIFVYWKWSGFPLNWNKIKTPKNEILFWIAILFSNTLGTALWDFLSHNSGLGFRGSALVIAVIIALLVLAKYYTKISSIVLFWIAFILTRPFGTNFGNFLSKPLKAGGLDLGNLWASLILIVILGIFITYVIIKEKEKSEKGQEVKIGEYLTIMSPIIVIFIGVSIYLGNLFLNPNIGRVGNIPPSWINTRLSPWANIIESSNRSLPNTKENRLKQYFFVSQVDPIFSIPEQIDQLAEITKTVQNISKLELYNQWSGTKNNIFPLNFLQQYPTLIIKQSSFLKNSVSIDQATEYQQQLEKVLSEYTKSLSYFEALLRENFKDKMDAKRFSATAWYYITPQIILNGILLMEKNADRLKSIIQDRRTCLENDITYCRLYTDNIPPLIEGNGYGSGHIDVPVHASKTWITAKTGCWWDGEDILTFDKMCQDFVGFCYSWWEVKNKVFYEKIAPGFPYEKLLFDRWIKIDRLNLVNPYMCNNNEYKAVLWNLDYYLGYVKKNPLVSNNGSLDRIISEEKTLLSDNGSDEASLSRLSWLYLDYILKNKDSRDLETLETMLSRYRLLTGNFMNNYLSLNESLLRLKDYFIVSAVAKKTADDKQMNEYLLTVRANYSYNFFIFSPFVWKIRDFPSFLAPVQSTDSIPPNPSLLDESTAIKTYGEKTIAKWNNLILKTEKAKYYSKYYKELWL